MLTESISWLKRKPKASSLALYGSHSLNHILISMHNFVALSLILAEAIHVPPALNVILGILFLNLVFSEFLNKLKWSIAAT